MQVHSDKAAAEDCEVILLPGAVQRPLLFLVFAAGFPDSPHGYCLPDLWLSLLQIGAKFTKTYKETPDFLLKWFIL
jgi:hypothetical protein